MVISTVNQVVYNGDGVTTAWPYTFRIIDATDIKLTIIDEDGTETDVSADYYVDTVNNTVYYPGYAPGAEPPEADQPAPVQAGQKFLIYRELPITQEKNLGEKWPFNVIELGLDKLTMILQQIAGWWDRCLKISPSARATHPDFDMSFPVEAGKSFRVNAEGTGFEVSDDPGIAAEAAYEALAQAIEAKDSAVNAQTAAEAAAALVDVQAVWFDCVADMVATDIPAGNTAGTRGYYAVNDGGNGTYAIREKTGDDVDDGGSIIFMDNGNVAELITNGVVVIEQFGAKGDGVTNDSAAISNAIKAANTVVFTPGKTYSITSSVGVLKSGVTLDLNSARILCPYDVSIKVIGNCAAGEVTYGYEGHGDLVIKNGTLEHCEILLAHAKNVTIQDVQFLNTDGHFIQIMSCSNVLISRCGFKGYNEDEAGDECINLDPCVYSAFHVYGNGSPSYDGTNNEYITIEECVCEKGTDEGYAKAVPLGFSHYHAGNELYHNHVVARNNHVILPDMANNSFKLYDLHNSTIDNNYFDVSTTPVNLAYCDGVDIHNNLALNSSVSPIYFASSDSTTGAKNVSFKNNVFQGSFNPRWFNVTNSSFNNVSLLKTDAVQIFTGSVGSGEDVLLDYPYTLFNRLIIVCGYVYTGDCVAIEVRPYGFLTSNFVEGQVLLANTGDSIEFKAGNIITCSRETQLRTVYGVLD